MKLGAIYPHTELTGDPKAVRRFGLAVEELGYDHIVSYDHVLGAAHADRDPKLWGPYTEHHTFHDPFVIFGYLAAITQRIEFVTGILILPQRQTVLVARQAADVDLLSGERLRLGVGIGWNYVEYDALGQNFHTRGKRMEEQVELMRRLWREPLMSFAGDFDRVDRAALNPRPNRRIPIWFGGFADAAMRRAVAIGDGFICADGAADALEQAARLQALLKESGRAAAEFGLQCNMLRAKSVESAVDTAQRWRDAGGTHAAVHTMGMNFTSVDQHIDYLAEIAAVRGANGL